MRTPIMLLLLGIVLIAAGCVDPKQPAATGPAETSIATPKASQFTKTLVTPHLEARIDPNTNVLWCSTFQLAWNEMRDLAGGPLKIEKAPPMVGILNKRTATKGDIDEPSYLAMAGIGPKAVEKMSKELAGKFAGRPFLRLLPPGETVPENGWVAFACLVKDLPFEEPFARCPRPYTFVDDLVAWFVLGAPPEFDESSDGYKDKLREHHLREAKVAAQVAIYDYRDEDDFVIELKTKSKGDRLLLAKVAPQATLGETVALVRRRVDASKPVKMDMDRGDELAVPLVDFDITRRYGELIGKHVGQSGMPVVEALQVIRFQLTEQGTQLLSGASLESWGAPKHRMRFDKPFLILLQRRDAKSPYFALWVANSELLVPMAARQEPATEPAGGGIFD